MSAPIPAASHFQRLTHKLPFFLLLILVLTVVSPLATATNVSTTYVSFASSAGTGSISYTAYPSPGDFETFINYTYTDFNSFENGLSGTVGGSAAYFKIGQVDGTGPATLLGGNIVLQTLGGTGTFSIVNASNGQNILSGDTSGGFIQGVLGTNQATMMFNLNTLSSSTLTSAQLSQITSLYINGTTSSALSLGYFADFLGPIGDAGDPYLNSFDLDFNASATNGGPPVPPTTPEPSSLILLAGGILGWAGIRRKA